MWWFWFGIWRVSSYWWLWVLSLAMSRFLKRQGTTDLNLFYPIRPENEADVPTHRFKTRVGSSSHYLIWKAHYIVQCYTFMQIYELILSLHCLFPQSGKTLSARRWNASFSQEGRLDIAKVLRRIQRGVTFIFVLNFLNCWICVVCWINVWTCLLFYII